MPEKPVSRGLTVPKNPAAMLRALNTKHAEEPTEVENKETDQQTNNTTILQTDTPTETSQPPEESAPATPLGTMVPTTSTKPQTIQPKNNPTNIPSNKPTKKQTNNTTTSEPSPVPLKRDGRTLRSRQPVGDPSATIVTSFRISVTTMEALDRYCFENRVRKQDVVEQALALYMTEDEE